VRKKDGRRQKILWKTKDAVEGKKANHRTKMQEPERQRTGGKNPAKDKDGS